MKTKMKRTLSIALLLTLLLNVFAGCGGNANSGEAADSNFTPVAIDDNEWLLVSEKSVSEWSGMNAIGETIYGYDEYGRLNYKKYSSDTCREYSNFEYYKNGEVKSYIEEEIYEDATFISEIDFEYDTNGNCICRNELRLDNDRLGTYSFSYDNTGNMISQKYECSYNGDVTETTNFKYNSKFDNELCVQNEIEVDGTEYYDSGDESYTGFLLEKYSYDDNGNMIKKECYVEADEPSGISVNGRYYVIDETTTYKWKKFGEIRGAFSSNEDEKTDKTNIATSDLGFDNIETWGSSLVEIQPDDDGMFIHSDDVGKYVIIKEGTHYWEFYPSKGQFLASLIYSDFVPKKTDVNSFTVLNNDTASIVEPYDSYVFKIANRSEESGVIIFTIMNASKVEYMISSNLIDTSKDSVYYKTGEYDREYYKFYLK